MELDLFRSFVAVAEARSFSGAARAMHSTQPTLSRQIAPLETELGVRLFERYGRTRGVHGQRPVAAAAGQGDRLAHRRGREPHARAGGRPQHGALRAAGNVIVMRTPVLASFLKAHPGSPSTSSRRTTPSSRRPSSPASWTAPSSRLGVDARGRPAPADGGDPAGRARGTASRSWRRCPSRCWPPSRCSCRARP